MIEQGYKPYKNQIERDNTSTMKLEVNGKASSGKRTRHFDIKYFYITDLIKRNILSTVYCPTDDMISDYMTKPLVGYKFFKFRHMIMNHADKEPAYKAYLERLKLKKQTHGDGEYEYGRTDDNSVDASTETIVGQ